MNCAQAKSWLSPYLDGVLTGHEMHALTEHMENCVDCAHEYSQLSRAQQLLTGLRYKKAPPDLALKLKVMASQEIARQRRRTWEGLRVHAENALNAFMVPATAGAINTHDCLSTSWRKPRCSLKRNVPPQAELAKPILVQSLFLVLRLHIGQNRNLVKTASVITAAHFAAA